MNLLIFTQKVDKDDPILGFFHRWLIEFSKHTESLVVICLEKGAYDLPSNVEVLSLGKEDGRYVFKYVFNFYKYIWRKRAQYSHIFVHMNQEYVLLGGLYWRLLGKKIFMWRNHAKGNLLTHLAVALSHKVFCTSPQSFTAKFEKTKLMPVGIDTDFWRPDPGVSKKPNSILFLGRIAPVKKVLEFIEWFNKLDQKFTATIAGESLPRDRDYENLVRSKAGEKFKFIGPVTQVEALQLYQTHETYVNFTLAGSFDKTILEAAACGTKVIVKNDDLRALEDKGGDELRDFVIENHSLKKLAELLFNEIK
jgi:glycosyltransferase involved in cell wall biosynthesis